MFDKKYCKKYNDIMGIKNCINTYYFTTLFILVKKCKTKKHYIINGQKNPNNKKVFFY